MSGRMTLEKLTDIARLFRAGLKMKILNDGQVKVYNDKYTITVRERKKMTEDKLSASVAMNNFDKLFERNGELVEERKKQVMIGAVRVLMNNCNWKCKGCPLLDKNSGGCFIEDRRPFEWELPEEWEDGRE